MANCPSVHIRLTNETHEFASALASAQFEGNLSAAVRYCISQTIVQSQLQEDLSGAIQAIQNLQAEVDALKMSVQMLELG